MGLQLQLAGIDIAIIVVFLSAVVALGLWMSRKEEASSEDYFLAGRGLSWWLIGISLIAANISAEQFVGMSGQAAREDIGLAVASYEWIAAVTLIAVAFLFLPKFLSSGIYTIPEYLEYRFTHSARTIMSLLMVVIYVGVNLATVIYLGAKALDPLLAGSVFGVPINIATLSWGVGLSAAVYVAAGGLKACAWADLIQGTALILGGAIIMVLAFMALDDPSRFPGAESPESVAERLGVEPNAGLVEKFAALKQDRMHMILPRTSTFLPWTAFLLGIWIPNLYYWGLNQYIMQRTLGASSLAQGQKGIVLAAFLKLIIPFIVCIPGIIALPLFAGQMRENAMNDPQQNKTTLAAFEAARANSAQSRDLFPFNANFATLHPELARGVLAYNESFAGVDGPSLEAAGPAELTARNEDVLRAALERDPGLKQRQILVGYDYDSAFPLLIRYLTPVGLRGFVLAALMGAVISSLAAMLNAASTIFTMDLYREFIQPNASQRTLVWVGRACVGVCVLIGCLIAPQLANPAFSGAFAYIQEFQGFISPGVLTIFLFGLFVPRTPRICGVIGLILSPLIYGILYFTWSDLAFLNRMAITCGVIAAVILVLTVVAPLKEPVRLPVQTRIALEPSPGAKQLAYVVLALTAGLYIIFW